MKPSLLALLLAGTVPLLAQTAAPKALLGPRFEVSYPADKGPGPFDGRVLVMISKDDSAEPRHQTSGTGLKTQQIFGIDVEGLKPGVKATLAGDVLGFPVESLAGVPAGTYSVQALLHKYETFRRSDGHVVKLPMDRGEGRS